MDVYRTEEEQVEAIKKWWKQNGNNLIMAVGVAILIIVGWQMWQDQKRAKGEAAATLYMELIEATKATASNDEETEANKATFNHLLKQIKSDYADSRYAVLASLIAAKQLVSSNDADAAEAELRWALEQQPSRELELLIKLRLAKVLMVKGDYQAALALIESQDAGALSSLYEELKGDLYLQLGDKNKARAAYKKALDAAGSTNQRPLLDLKYKDLATHES